MCVCVWGGTGGSTGVLSLMLSDSVSPHEGLHADASTSESFFQYSVTPQGRTCLFMFRGVLTNVLTPPPHWHDSIQHNNKGVDREHEKCICRHVSACSQTWPLKIQQPTHVMTWTQSQAVYRTVCVRGGEYDPLILTLFTGCWVYPSTEFTPGGDAGVWPFD